MAVGQHCCDRPGLAYITEQSIACVVPISITGAQDLLGGGKTPVKIEFHAPIAAPHKAHKSARRSIFDAYGETAMARIAAGLPDAQRGRFAIEQEAQAPALAVSGFTFHAQELRGG